ncbi:MAG: thermonuclease family protein [Hyphomicrobiaceae bacterium]
MAGTLARGGAERAGSAAKAMLDWLSDIAVAALGLAGLLVGHLAQALIKGLAAAGDVLGRPGVAGPLMLAGVIALLGGAGRYWFAGRGFDMETSAAVGIGATCLLLGLAPALALGHTRLVPPRLRLPGRMPVIGVRGSIAAGGALLLAVAGGVVAMGMGKSGLSMLGHMPSLPSLKFGTSETVEGRARPSWPASCASTTGQSRLEGVELPDPSQRCVRSNGRSWRYMPAAKDATAKLVRGHKLTCEIGAADASGQHTGTCHYGETDIAEVLVRDGYGFTSGGLMPRYAQAEQAAREAKAGIWAAAEPERPSAWRARLWEAARKAAPDGCPIKGRISRGERVYLLPWSDRYQRVRVRKKRGERWFCSEEEAAAAGWRSAEKG